MFKAPLPSVWLAVLVSAPALIVGRFAAHGDYARAGHVALMELFVILIASGIAAARRLD